MDANGKELKTNFITCERTSGGKIKLKHGQIVTIKGLPIGTAYTVTEDEANSDGYSTTYISSASNSFFDFQAAGRRRGSGCRRYDSGRRRSNGGIYQQSGYGNPARS